VTVLAAAEAPAAAEATSEAVTSSAGRGAAGGAAVSQPRQRQPRQRAASKSQKISRTNYQPVILMEFVACILLTAVTPIATKKDQQGLSPYAGKDIVKLSAITVTFLILAMLSVGGRTAGRFAAWFGGLILLADGLYEASNIVKDLRLVGGGGTATTVAPGAASQPGGILPTPTGTQPTPLGEVPSG
jgi:hypothetical protein